MAKYDNIIDDMSKLAFAGGELPDGYKYAEQLLFQRLRLLYAYVKLGYLDAEKGKSEKQKILEQYISDSFNCDLLDRHAELWNKMGEAVSDYRKNRTIENADRLVDLIEGRL